MQGKAKEKGIWENTNYDELHECKIDAINAEQDYGTMKSATQPKLIVAM